MGRLQVGIVVAAVALVGALSLALEAPAARPSKRASAQPRVQTPVAAGPQTLPTRVRRPAAATERPEENSGERPDEVSEEPTEESTEEPLPDADALAGLGYAWGAGADEAWRAGIEALRAEEAAADLVASLQALPPEALHGPAGRSLLVALGDVGGPAAVEALAAQLEGPPPVSDEAVLTRLMGLEALARATLRSGDLVHLRSFHTRMGALVEDPAQHPATRQLAADLLRATAPRND